MRKVAFILGLVISLAVVGFGQRTITNLDLEKFQQKRLAAEKDYRENYERMGFPSPEELDKQREANMAASVELAAQLRQARLEKERLELEQRNLDLEAAQINDEIDDSSYSGSNGVLLGAYGGFYSNGSFRRYRGRGGFFPRNPRFGRSTGGYRVTPVGVYPTGGTRPQPFFSRSVRRGGAITHGTHGTHGPRR